MKTRILIILLQLLHSAYTGSIISVESTGSTQRITFSTDTTYASIEHCYALITGSTIPHLGAEASCTFPASNTLQIEYGITTTYLPETITLFQFGFTPSIVGNLNFQRPNLPHFLLGQHTVTGYQDLVGDITLTEPQENGGTGLYYQWEYVGNQGPQITGNIDTYEFRYWDMKPGEYVVSVTMKDPANPHFGYRVLSTPFTVLQSCITECEQVVWKFTTNPGECTEEYCVSGLYPSDSYILSNTVHTPSPLHPYYSVPLTYQPGSRGGKNLLLVPPSFSGGIPPEYVVACGGALNFPTIFPTGDSPDCMSSGVANTLQGVLMANTLQGEEFTHGWVQPQGVDLCDDRELTCTIPPLGLVVGGPYEFRIQLGLVCHGGGVWNELVFNLFDYSPTYMVVTEGSIQTLTTTHPLLLTGGSGCEELFMGDSFDRMGVSPVCTLEHTVFTIRYGHGCVTGGEPMHFNTDGLYPCIQETFLSPNFRLSVEGADAPAYQDVVATFRAGSVLSPNLVYIWSYTKSPSNSQMPDLALQSTGTIIFEYWGMSPGEYRIRVQINDTHNSAFYSKEDSPIFTVLQSCSYDCDTITWMFTNSPGSCTSECVTGAGAEDVIVFTTTTVSGSAFLVTAKYSVGSKGGNDLSIRSAKYNDLNSVPCGASIRFPGIKMAEDAPEVQSSLNNLNLAGILTTNGLLQGSEYTAKWVTPDEFTSCIDGTAACAIPPNSLAVNGGEYLFKLQLRMLCLGDSIIWDEIAFKPFEYSETMAVGTEGSIQRVAFGVGVTAVDGDTCDKLLVPSALLYLGNGCSCQLGGDILTIKYGSGTDLLSHRIHLLGTGFVEDIEGSFLSAPLPSFTLSVSGGELEGYQDNSLLFTMGSLVNTGFALLKLEWSYITLPDPAPEKPELASISATSFRFNYWEMSPGEYKIRVKITDPENSAFYFQQESPTLRVLESCIEDCESVVWKFLSNPGECSTDCITGHMPEDTFIFATSYVIDHYEVQATFQPGSKGGQSLRISSSKYNDLTNVACGMNLRFPGMFVVDLDFPLCLSSNTSIDFAGVVLANGLTRSDYSQNWVQPTGFSACVNGISNCSMPAESLPVGGPYVFKVQLQLACHAGVVWSEGVFNEFDYSPQYVVSTSGSVQSITFASEIQAVGGTNCEDLLSPVSLMFLGTGASCAVAPPNIILIKYGYDTTLESRVISLIAKSITPCTEATFYRPLLPKFTLFLISGSYTAYQDNVATFTAGNIINEEAASLNYEWSYLVYPEGSTRPDISTSTFISYSFQYRLMSPGSYQVHIKQTDPANPAYYYEDDSQTFTVLESCSSNCETVTWKFSSDPGSCSTDCVTGHHLEDTFTFTTTPVSDYFEVTATYQPKSIGGNNLILDPTQHNDLSSVPCGEGINFPYITITENSPEIQAYNLPLTISATTTPNGLTKNVDFTETWEQPTGFSSCVDGTTSCLINPGSFAVGEEIHSFKVLVGLECRTATDPWSTATFNPFKYSSTLAVTTLGSLQMISFSEEVRATDGEECEKLLISTDNLGTGFSCSLANNIFTIKYGWGIIEGTETIELLSTGFTPPQEGSFSRPKLPRFHLALTTGKLRGYQDNIAIFSATGIINRGSANLEYEWTYLLSPSGSTKPPPPALTSTNFVFKYWELSQGDYQIKLKVKDPGNSVYYYSEESEVFTVINSCMTDCDTVYWKLTYYPGNCSQGCVTGVSDADTLSVTTLSLSDYFVITAVYSVGSLGGQVLNVVTDKYTYLDSFYSVPCGGNIRFPSALPVNDNIPDCLSSGDELIMNTNVNSNGLSVNDYTLKWSQPDGSTACIDNTESCTLPPGTLPPGGPKVFKVQLLLACHVGTPYVWSEAIFKEFDYSPTFTITVTGSIQRLTFAENIQPSGRDRCEDLFESVTPLGTEAECNLTSLSTGSPPVLSIYYGTEAPEDEPTLQLLPTGFIPCLSGSFPRAILPRFTLLQTGGDVPSYQDTSLTITAGDIVNTGGAPLVYIWSYVLSPLESTKPDLSLVTSSTYIFNYWLFTPGDYTINLKVVDPANSLFKYEEMGDTFTVLESCSYTCETVTWKFSTSPDCSSDCVLGYGVRDTFTFTTSSISDYFILSATYLPKSTGGNNLRINAIYTNGLNNAPCGSEVRFPSIEVEGSIPEVQSSTSPLILSAQLTTNGKSLNTEYTETWVEPDGVSICIDGTSTCTIPAEGLDEGMGPYIFKIQLKIVCQGGSDVWDEAAFQAFQYSAVLSVSTIGSIQRIVFSYDVVDADGGECEKLLTDLTHLGTGFECLLVDSVLSIKYGFGTIEGAQTISLLSSGFIPSTEGSFVRPPLPNFSLRQIGSQTPAYQDNVATFDVHSIINMGDAALELEWSYLLFPGGATKPDISSLSSSSFSFKYWDLTPGEYRIRITLKDPENAPFYYAIDSNIFVVLDSCSANCDIITWKFTNDPGECTTDCVTGYGIGDTFTFSTTPVSDYFEVAATYQPESIGGNKISIIPSKYKDLISVSCGEGIYFPYITITENSPEIQAYNLPLTISATTTPNGLTKNVDFTETWEQPTGFSSCVDGTTSCIINPGSFAVGEEIHSFKVLVGLECRTATDPWSTATFNPFKYSSTITVSTIGSIQTVNFPVPVAAVGGDTCEDLLSPDSLPHFGVGYECVLTSTTLSIKYGSGTTVGIHTISLIPLRFNPTTSGTFTRAALPSFSLISAGISDPSYQDNIATISVRDIINGGNAPLVYTWSYLSVPDGVNTRPDLSSITGTSVTFNYWEMSPGDYQIRVKITDPSNSPFYFQQDSSIFTVLESCSTTCQKVTWKFTQNPGFCSSECVTGALPDDTFTFSTTAETGYFLVTAAYLAGSAGGQTLTLVPELHNELTTVSCGAELEFPIITLVNQNVPTCQSSGSPLTLSGSITGNSFSSPEYIEIWSYPEAFSTGCADDTTSCSISPGELPIGGPYTYTFGYRLLCVGSTDIWLQDTFRLFDYAPTLTTDTIGSIQTITFSEEVRAEVQGADSCDDLLTSTSISPLGTGATCSLLTSTTMKIKYGSNTVTGQQIISLLSSGFYPCTEGSFTRSILPQFDISQAGANSAFQDHQIQFTASSIINSGGATLKYIWSYIYSPDGGTKPDISSISSTTYTFNYWELTPGDYQIRIIMEEEANAAFFYHDDSKVFTVLESCSSQCDSVSWKFTQNPGSCSSDCISGQGITDTFDFTSTQTDTYYVITATYKVNSQGGNALSIHPAKYNDLHNVECGTNIKFPYIEVSNDAPEVQPSLDPLTLSVILTTNDRTLTTDFTQAWIQPDGVSLCTYGTSTCTIPAQNLGEGGGPYLFKMQLKIVCQGGSDVWDEVVFKAFQYSSTLSVSTTGSVQQITFSSTVTAADGVSCEKLLTEITHLGTGFECLLAADVLTIKYGYGTIVGAQTITLLADGFSPSTDGSFARPPLPKFTLLPLNSAMPAYQDNSATFIANAIVNTGDATLEYEWTYVNSPTGATKPDLSVKPTTTTSVTFNYWEISPGQYQIKIKVTDPANTPYYYEEESQIFTILNSCSSNCESITWKFSNDPGTCAEDCVTGFTPGDTFIFSSREISGYFEVKATYQPESTGDSSISLESSKYNGLITVPCGKEIKFPKIVVNDNAEGIQSSEEDLTLTGTLTTNSKQINVDYTQIWVHPPEFTECVNGETSCTISTGDLSIGGPYAFLIQLRLICQGASANVWSSAEFTQFYYSPTLETNYIASIQTITFSAPVSPVNGDECGELLTPESIPHLGTGSKCSLISEKVLEIKYGGQMTDAAETITLLASGFSPSTEGSFARPTLPRFTLSQVGGAVPQYQDSQATFTADSIVNPQDAILKYKWSYLAFPTGNNVLKPAIFDIPTARTYTFKYWEITPGDYKIKLRVIDPTNQYFYYEEESSVFTILDSCSTSCHTVNWKFTSDPGNCVADCVVGGGLYDTFIFSKAPVSDYFVVTASYKPGSTGNTNLRIIPSKYSYLNNVECGVDVKFPTITQDQDIPEVQSSLEDIILSGTLTLHGNELNTDFTETWVQPDGVYTCGPGISTCTIPAGSLTVGGGPYLFKIQLKIVCQGGSDVWDEVVFQAFQYSSTLSVSTTGSVQQIAFSSTTIAADGDSCEKLLTETTHLGTGFECLISANVLYIKYGYGTVEGAQTINLLADGFNPSTEGSFARPPLPKFTLLQTGASAPAYQDNSATFTADSIVNNGGAPLVYEWTYINSPTDATKPDLASVTSTSYTFKYWELTPGSYKIHIKQTDPNNAPWYYEVDSSTFTILVSCSADCEVVTWKFTRDPGSCTADCVIGHGLQDAFVFSTISLSDYYEVTATYQPESLGGNPLRLVPENYIRVDPGYIIPCGGDLRFPNIQPQNQNIPNCHSKDSPLLLPGILNANTLTANDDYIVTWEEPSGLTSCMAGTSYCTVTEGSLPIGGPYTFKVQLKLVCQGGSPQVWSEGIFKSFDYSPTFTTNTIGSIQIITFSDDISLVKDDLCTYLFTRDSVAHMGTGAICSLLSSTTLQIKYGAGTTPGEQTIIFLESGFDPCVEGNFLRGILPSFSILQGGGEVQGYQDTQVTFTADSIVNTGGAELEYGWKYIAFPTDATKPDLSTHATITYTFNYWELTPGEYKIHISQTDTANTQFSYERESGLFTVLNSCSYNCVDIIWKFSSDPGGCEVDCITGYNIGDTFIFETKAVDSYYTLTASYQPLSKGGQSLRIIPENNNGLNSIECGTEIKFPSISVESDAPEILDIDTDLSISAITVDNSFLPTGYSKIWVQPDGFVGCVHGTTSCTIPAGELSAEGGPYVFKIEMKIQCQGGSDVWTQAVFKQFEYSSTLSVATIGSIQYITFSSTVTAAEGVGCDKLLTSTAHLGTDFECLLATNILTIKYGYGTTDSAQTITLLTSGFSPPTEGTFPRPPLPYFTLLQIGGSSPAYQDSVTTITASSIVNTGDAPLVYEWSYLDFPGGGRKPDISIETSTTYSFNYWELSPGDYQIKLKVTDPLNTPFYYEEDSNIFTVLESCVESCNIITWKFSNNPGNVCSENCVSGLGTEDNIEYSVNTGITPYTVTVTMNIGSKGGNSLLLVPSKHNNLNNVECGVNIKFPSIQVDDGQNSPEIQSSGSELILGGILTTNGKLLTTDFTETWVQPDGVSICTSGTSTCTISAGGLTEGGPYLFKIQLKIVCQGGSDVWNEAVFKEFQYSSALSVSTTGSVQQITFSSTVTAADGVSCEKLLTEITHLGTGFECLLADDVLTIKYGYGTVEGAQTITLLAGGFSPSTEGSFARPPLPKFTLLQTGASAPAYQDNSATFTADSIVNTGSAILEYEWTYVNSPIGATKPDLSSEASTSVTFNYWEIGIGDYQIRLKMTDTGNGVYYYQEESTIFTVLNSCSESCEKVIWKYTNDPGTCTADCLTGHNVDDKFEFSFTKISDYFIVTAAYLPPSEGGATLTLDPAKFNSLDNVECGQNIRFPSIQIITTDIPESQSSAMDLTLSALVSNNQLNLNQDYTQEWEQPPDFTLCASGTSSCIVPAHSLTEGGGPYAFKIILQMTCQNILSTNPWAEVAFNPFYYSPTLGAATQGSTQTITFSSPISVAEGAGCADLLQSDSLVHLGTGAECELTAPTILVIKYGYGTTSLAQTISLYPSAFDPLTEGGFARPALPRFTLVQTGGGDPAYQDMIVTLTADSIVNTGGVGLLYTWSYTTSPGTPGAIKPGITTHTGTYFEFPFWTLTPGDYRVKIKLTDPSNPLFYYEEQSDTFTVLESCSSNCEIVTWKFTSNPGNCPSNCVTGFGIEDTFVFETKAVSSYYTVTATYQPESLGGGQLLLVPENFGDMDSRFAIKCGEGSKFPTVDITSNAPESQYSGAALELAGAVNSNDLDLGSDFTQDWVQPGGFTACLVSTSTCTINAGGLVEGGGPYVFKIQLKVACVGGDVWSEAAFTPFRYSSTLTVATLGSVQVVTFATGVTTPNGDSCAAVLSVGSLAHLGTDYECSLSSANTLLIKYGYGTTDSAETITLKGSGFSPVTNGDFSRAPLPKFDLTIAGESLSAYQDNIATIIASNLINSGSAPLQYEWTYEEFPAEATKPDISSVTGTSLSLNFWELTPGDYKVHLKVTDTPANTAFYYEDDSPTFTVLNSCFEDCEKVIWRCTHPPGLCSEGCVNGFHQGDTFSFATTAISNYYAVIATYLPSSQGEVNLTLATEKYSTLPSEYQVQCGQGIKFPGVFVFNDDTSECRSSGETISLARSLLARDFVGTTDYTEEWIEPSGSNHCVDGSSPCVIPTRGLDVGGPYEFRVKLRLVCQGGVDIWSLAIFNQFNYSPTFIVTTLGSIQKLTFSDGLALTAGSSCTELLASDCISYLGDGALCSMPSSTVFQINYGTGTLPGEQNLNLLAAGFIPCTEGTFPRAILPSFTLSMAGGELPAYQDQEVIFTADSIVNMGDAVLDYTWSYITSGSIKPDLSLIKSTSYTLKYRECTPGSYKIKLRVSDPPNGIFMYEEESDSFTILQSCTTNCEVITWKFTTNPGNVCATECVSGLLPGDTYTYSKSTQSSPPYTIRVTMGAGSKGGNMLYLAPQKHNSLNNVGCGENLRYPGISILTDAESTQSSDLDLVLSATLDSNGRVSGTHFDQTWQQPGNISICENGKSSCRIPAGSLMNTSSVAATNTTYIFILDLKVVCNGKVWESIAFTPFLYLASPISKIIGGDEIYISDTQISLSGNESINPNTQSKNNEGLSYHWECFQNKEQNEVCKTANNKELGIISTEISYIISENTLEKGNYYLRLRVTLIEGGLTAMSGTIISIIAPDAGPLLTLTGTPKDHIINPQISHTFMVSLKEESSESSESIADYNIEWNIEPGVKETLSAGKYYTIPKNSLMSSTEEYNVSCKVGKEGKGSTTISTIFRVAKSVTVGTLTADLEEGYAFHTLFTFTSTDFEPGEGDILLYNYTMKIQGSGVEIPIENKGNVGNILITDLPLGNENYENKITVKVRASNSYGLTGSTNTTVTVKPSPDTTYDLAFVENILESENTDTAQLQLISKLAGLGTQSQSPRESTKCGYCATRYGTCNQITLQCVCIGGYASPDCSLTQAQAYVNKGIHKYILEEIRDIIDSLGEEGNTLVLSVTALTSEGAYLGDFESNIILESVAEKLVNLGKTSSSELFIILSNAMGGIVSELPTTTEAKSANGVRLRACMGNIKKVAKLGLKTQGVGIPSTLTVTDNVEVIGIIQTREELESLNIGSAEDIYTPIVTLSKSISENPQSLISVLYITTPINQHPSNPLTLLSHTLDLTISDYTTETAIHKENMASPITLIFTMSTIPDTNTTHPPTCLYYDEGIEGYSGEGLKGERNGVLVTCASTHLSEFVVAPFLAPLDIVESGGGGGGGSDGGYIALGVIASLALILIIVAVVYCLYRRV